MWIGKCEVRKGNWGEVEEREGDSVIGRRRVVLMNGWDGFKFKVWGPFEIGVFKFWKDGANGKLY